ncbi:hypothetical protein RJ639_043069 [Escallonia herrerae]|uniref:Uncharacterized protein n=1 Tax=Escallonia herrerae TaxID=1293975 RepID=A0AA89B482_9ASTE|nr:hypothetical protein RJ639_043069 [Escallonia herrerae]
MNSMFSSFDAVCAELLGQTGRAPVSPSKKVDGFLQSHQQTQKREQTKVTDEANEKKAGRPQRRARRRMASSAFFPLKHHHLKCFDRSAEEGHGDD